MAAKDEKTIDTPARLLGAIDVGTSAIRLVIGQAHADGQWEVLERLQRSTRLGQDTFRRGRLRTASMQSAVAILRDYRDYLHRYHVQEVRSVATSAVREAKNGRDALALMSEEAPDLVVLDLMMPEMDGFEFVSELRLLESGRHLPVVVVTALEVTAEDRSRLNGQVSRILHKGSFTREELIGELKAHPSIAPLVEGGELLDVFTKQEAVVAPIAVDLAVRD